MYGPIFAATRRAGAFIVSGRDVACAGAGSHPHSTAAGDMLVSSFGRDPGRVPAVRRNAPGPGAIQGVSSGDTGTVWPAVMRAG